MDEPPTYPMFGFDQKSATSHHIQVNPTNESPQVFYTPLPYQSNHLFTPNMYQNYAQMYIKIILLHL